MEVFQAGFQFNLVHSCLGKMVALPANLVVQVSTRCSELFLQGLLLTFHFLAALNPPLLWLPSNRATRGANSLHQLHCPGLSMSNPSILYWLHHVKPSVVPCQMLLLLTLLLHSSLSPAKSWRHSHPSLRALMAEETCSAFLGSVLNYCTQLVTSPTPTLYL